VKLIAKNKIDNNAWRQEARFRGWSYVSIPIVKQNINRLLEICLADKTCGQDYFLQNIDPILK